MNIILNGEEKALDSSVSLLDLLKDLSLKPETVVIELNTEIIQPEAYSEQKLNEADSVEIIRFVGGG